MTGKRWAAVLLALCLLAGCKGAENPNIPESSSPPPEPPASSSQTEPKPPLSQVAGRPALEPQPEGSVLPQEDPEKPGWLAGGRMYYGGGNRLTLYAMEPESGTLRVVRDNDFWNGREVESVSPSGNRLLLSSWDGAPSRRVVALSLYDVEKGTLTNLSRTIEEPYGSWTEEHWFRGYELERYCFVDEDTILYRYLCQEETPGSGHFHLYSIGEDGVVTSRLLELEHPPLDQERLDRWDSNCLYLPENRQVLCHLPTAENGYEWLAWDVDSGSLLSRRPGKNFHQGPSASESDSIFLAASLIKEDTLYYLFEGPREAETFDLRAYHINTDTVEVLATGPVPRNEQMEREGNWDRDARGAFEDVWLGGFREDGSIWIRADITVYNDESRKDGYDYWEADWNPEQGSSIRFERKRVARVLRAADPASQPDWDKWLFIPVSLSEDRLLRLYLPETMQTESCFGGPPHILATLPTGEILFLAE